jgi:hypothetical protein
VKAVGGRYHNNVTSFRETDEENHDIFRLILIHKSVQRAIWHWQRSTPRMPTITNSIQYMYYIYLYEIINTRQKQDTKGIQFSRNYFLQVIKLTSSDSVDNLQTAIYKLKKIITDSLN